MDSRPVCSEQTRKSSCPTSEQEKSRLCSCSSPVLVRGEQISKPLGSLLKPAPAPGRDSDAKEPSRKVHQETRLQPRVDGDAALGPLMFGFLQMSLGTPCIPSACVPETWGWHPHVSPPPRDQLCCPPGCPVFTYGGCTLVTLRLPFSTASSSLPQPNTLRSRRYKTP